MSEPGWLADPSERHDYRYFDGTEWTELVSTGGEISSDPMPGAPAAPAGAATLTTGPGGAGVPARRRRVWPWLVGVGSALAAVALAAVVGLALSADDGAIDEDAAVTDTVDVGDGAWAVAVADDSIWVTSLFDGAVSRLDPDTAEVTETIDVGGTPRGVAVSDDAVWVTSEGDGTVTRIDRAGGVTDTIEVGGEPSGIEPEAPMAGEHGRTGP